MASIITDDLFVSALKNHDYKSVDRIFATLDADEIYTNTHVALATLLQDDSLEIFKENNYKLACHILKTQIHNFSSIKMYKGATEIYV
jgi:hypothetical protein